MQIVAFWLCKNHIKKALSLSAFFIALILFGLPVSAQDRADNCMSPALSAPVKATVKWVYDGDTILLRNKQKIRIIGIDTPEVKHHKQKAQAYGAKAREALRELLNKHHYKILLRYGRERLDKYGRTLAHVYLPDGTNIANWLLERGYARTLAFPPNVILADCYHQIEERAQQKSLRIWRYKNHQIKTTQTLSSRYSGYLRFKGIIKKIKHHKKSMILTFAGNNKRPIRIKIKKSDYQYFKKMKIDSLYNQTIIVSGILKNRKGKRTIYVNYPTQIKKVKRRQETTRSRDAIIKWSFEKK